MTPDQFQQFLKSNEEATGRAIETHVNGKIRNMDAKLDAHIIASQEHWDKSTKFMEELRPVRDGIFTLQSLAKFFKWIGLPSLAIIAYWLIKKL